MTTCEKCNTENLDGSQYCDECGAALGQAVRRKHSVPTGDASGGHPLPQPPAESRASLAPLASATSTPQVVHSIAAAGPVAVAEQGAHSRLVIERGRSAGKQFTLNDDETQIGRWDADGGIFPDVDLDADDPEAKVSRRHARIVRREGQYYIEDLGSTNGTFINRGRRLLPGDRQALRDGDEIIVGKTFLRFQILK